MKDAGAESEAFGLRGSWVLCLCVALALGIGTALLTFTAHHTHSNKHIQTTGLANLIGFPKPPHPCLFAHPPPPPSPPRASLPWPYARAKQPPREARPHHLPPTWLVGLTRTQRRTTARPSSLTHLALHSIPFPVHSGPSFFFFFFLRCASGALPRSTSTSGSSSTSTSTSSTSSKQTRRPPPPLAI